MKTAAIYARVSSDQQKENKTIDSQVSALLGFADQHGYLVPKEYIFKDEEEWEKQVEEWHIKINGF